MAEPIPIRHVVALPYPGRGHINPMLNICRRILNSDHDIVISFVITEEWLGLLFGSSQPHNFSFRTIPNVIPSEIGRAKDFAGFYEAVLTKMEAPVEQLLDRLQLPEPCVIIYDTNLCWAVGLGNRRNIPVASFYTMSATVFSIFHHSDLILQNRRSDPQEMKQLISCIPGIPSMRITDLPTPFLGKGHEIFPKVLESIKLVPKTQYLLFASVYELESQVIDSLRQELPVKIYSLGPTIPSFNIETSIPAEKPYYIKWLDAQPESSVLYISQGSFLSVSNAQLEEIIAGVCDSGVRFLWVARWEAERFHGRSNGLVVPWCDQLKVLCHPSVGGFWSHCGWNSTKEGAFAGVPMLTFPIFLDQVTNSKMIAEDWKIGLKVKQNEDKSLVTREEVAGLVLSFMDFKSEEAKERIRRAKEIREICMTASAGDGSSEVDILAFIRDFSRR